MKYPTEPLIDIKIAELEGECVHEPIRGFVPNISTGTLCKKCWIVLGGYHIKSVPNVTPRAHSNSVLINYAVEKKLDPIIYVTNRYAEVSFGQTPTPDFVRCYYKNYDSPAQAARIAGWNAIISTIEQEKK